MTIGIGFCRNAGIVLASDSQHTVSGYIKGYDGKIRTTIFDNLNVLAIVGAGNSDYIQTAKDKAIEGVRELNTFPEIADRLETNLLGFFDKHLARWAYYAENERPDVELLIGVTMRQGPFGLFHYSGTSFRRVGQKAIGSGILLADNLITQLTSVEDSVEKSTSLAVYILSKVKKQVDGCGGFTDLMALRKNGDFAFTEIRDIEKIERELEEIEKSSTKVLTEGIESKLVRLSWHSEHKRKDSKTVETRE